MDLKKLAAERALQFLTAEIRVLGLGTGTTAERFLELLGTKIKTGQHKQLVGIPTSSRTEEFSKRLNIPLKSIDEVAEIDLTIDGADEIDKNLNLIKGHGGALTREKMVARATKMMIIVADESKRVDQLGKQTALPVEVLPFGWTHTQREITKLGAQPNLRMADGRPFKTDQGNYILDCSFRNGISNPYKLDQALNGLTGLVEHGLFLDLAHIVILASRSGVEVQEKEWASRG